MLHTTFKDIQDREFNMEEILINFVLGEIVEECGRSKTIAQQERRKQQISRYMLLFKSKTFVIRSIPKIENYFNKIGEYPDDVFKSHFRMNRRTFEALLKQIEQHWNSSFSGRPKIDAEKALYMTLWRLSNSTAYRIISDRFHIARGTTHSTFQGMTELLAKLLNKYVRWSRTQNEFQKIMFDFQQLRHERPFPNVVGCLDSTHVQILTPKDEGASYYNRKGTHSIILQAVCDSKSRFIDIYFGWPGRCHDASVWENCPLKRKLDSGDIRLPEGSHLLGDSAFPLSTYLMVPFRDNGYLSIKEKKYNTYHSSTRVCIEQAFGVLKGKFRILQHLPIYNISEAKNIVLSCVVLHNLIIENEGLDLEDIVAQRVEIAEDNSSFNNTQASYDEAKKKRNSIANSFEC